MAAAAHHIGRAEHDEVVRRRSVARGLLVDREFGDRGAQRAKLLAHRRAVVVVRQHADIGRARGGGQSRDRGGHLGAARHDPVEHVVDGLDGEPGALGQLVALLRLDVAMVVEGEQIDAAFTEPLNDLGLGLEIVGLVTQVEAGVGGELRPQRLDRIE
ncbi:hypothetical protein ACVIM5_006206 [Bradyrhizobium sp. USDA 4512]